MYKVADDMRRLEYYADMPLSLYSDSDIRYIKGLMNESRGFIAEGAEITLYSSCKYIVNAVEKECSKNCFMNNNSANNVYFLNNTYHVCARKQLPKILNEFTNGDLECFISNKLKAMYFILMKEVFNC